MKAMKLGGVTVLIGLILGGIYPHEAAVTASEQPVPVAIVAENLAMDGEYTCIETTITGHEEFRNQEVRVTLNSDSTSSYRSIYPFETEPYTGTWAYSPTEALIFLERYSYKWLTATVDLDRNFSASHVFSPTDSEWLRCNRIEFNQAIYLPLMIEKPSLDLSGSYSCILWEYGLIWKTGSLILDADGKSFYKEYGSEYGPRVGRWAFKEGSMMINFTNFLVPQADVDRATRRFSRVTYDSVGEQLRLSCYPQ